MIVMTDRKGRSDMRTKTPPAARVLAAALVALCFHACLAAGTCHAARIKDIAYVNGVRPNILIGYGLVVGLKATGDKAQTRFTTQSLANMLERMGVTVEAKATKVNNVAAVMVTCELPPFARVGNRVDATVSSMGDASSLEGGVLLMTPLKGGDGTAYAVAQGPITVGGFAVEAKGASVNKHHPTVGRIAHGALGEQEGEFEALRGDTVTISLMRPDFTNVRKVVERINGTFRRCATAPDGGSISLLVPEEYRGDKVKFLSIIENLDVRPESQAKVVVDEKTGTIVIGEDVRIATVAISHGNINVEIKENAKVSQPLPFSNGGQTTVTPDTAMKVEEQKGHFYHLQGGTSIKELVNALNAIGVSTRDVIIILQTIKAAGALQAELEVI
jgi:flagellar P-ring protein precursor FlgI